MSLLDGGDMSRLGEPTRRRAAEHDRVVQDVLKLVAAFPAPMDLMGRVLFEWGLGVEQDWKEEADAMGWTDRPPMRD